MNSSRPIEIVGGGLAGLSLGLALRRAGVAAMVFEAGDYPRHRVCGEFIAGLDATTIGQLGLAPILADALAHRDVTWFIGEKQSRIQRLPTPALGLSRYVLDARLAAAFVAAGGQLRTRSRVAADGAPPGRVWANGRRQGRSPWMGLKFHVRGLSLATDLELHLGDQAYTGLARIDEDTVNVCGLFRRRAISVRGPKLLLDYLRAAGLPLLAGRLESAEIDGPSFCAVAALCFDRGVTRPYQLSLGDAYAMIPPFTGNGMAMAFQSAALALDPLLAFARGDADWTETCRIVNTAMRQRFRVRLGSASALHSFLLRPSHQRWFNVFNRANLLPLRPLYAALH